LSSIGKTVLVVDDQQCIRTSISLVLAEFGYSVRSAEDGHSALRAIGQQNPDILISDLTMPGMSGRELLTHVRRLFPGIRVIATSGSFSGKEVPASVLADALYLKGSGVSALLRLLRALPRMNDRMLRLLKTEQIELDDARIIGSAIAGFSAS
jgi:CheY-like chemotaxis protein